VNNASKNWLVSGCQRALSDYKTMEVSVASGCYTAIVIDNPGGTL